MIDSIEIEFKNHRILNEPHICKSNPFAVNLLDEAFIMKGIRWGVENSEAKRIR